MPLGTKIVAWMDSSLLGPQEMIQRGKAKPLYNFRCRLRVTTGYYDKTAQTLNPSLFIHFVLADILPVPLYYSCHFSLLLIFNVATCLITDVTIRVPPFFDISAAAAQKALTVWLLVERFCLVSL